MAIVEARPVVLRKTKSLDFLCITLLELQHVGRPPKLFKTKRLLTNIKKNLSIRWPKLKHVGIPPKLKHVVRFILTKLNKACCYAA